jgi:hypothetical protein
MLADYAAISLQSQTDAGRMPHHFLPALCNRRTLLALTFTPLILMPFIMLKFQFFMM